MSPDLKANNLSSVLRAFEYIFAALIIICLVVLAMRSGLRLDDTWDTIMYHFPFAALRAGLDIPYELNDRLMLAYQGFPPLPHLVQGWLWRLTGTLNATGVVNMLAFLAFLGVCYRVFRAPLSVVAAIALTAPLVLIHTTVSYIDLFGNSWLALGIVSLFYAFYLEKQENRLVLAIGLAGLVLAAWTKFQLTPLVGFFLLLYVFSYRSTVFENTHRLLQPLFVILAAGFLAAIPYIHNWIIYGNPFWPVPVPLVTEWFPHSLYFAKDLENLQFSRELVDVSQTERFFRSMFEIGHPHAYDYRARWILDQGSGFIEFRAGGWWNVSVVIYLAMLALILGFLKSGKRVQVFVAGVTTILLLSVLPASHELRYYLFLPLSWAGLLGILYPLLREKAPLLATIMLVTIAGLFLYVSNINREYYAIEKRDFAHTASKYGLDLWWSRMSSEEINCAADMQPLGIVLTGPTMSEFRVVSRSSVELCPPGSNILKFNSYQPFDEGLITRAMNEIYELKDYERAIRTLDYMLLLQPSHYGALWYKAVALDQSGRVPEAIEAWQKVVDEADAKGYTDADPARQRLRQLKPQ